MRSDKPNVRRASLFSLTPRRAQYPLNLGRLTLMASVAKAVLLRRRLPLAAGVGLLTWGIVSHMQRRGLPRNRKSPTGRSSAAIEAGLGTAAKIVLVMRVLRAGLSLYQALAPSDSRLQRRRNGPT